MKCIPLTKTWFPSEYWMIWYLHQCPKSYWWVQNWRYLQWLENTLHWQSSDYWRHQHVPASRKRVPKWWKSRWNVYFSICDHIVPSAWLMDDLISYWGWTGTTSVKYLNKSLNSKIRRISESDRVITLGYIGQHDKETNGRQMLGPSESCRWGWRLATSNSANTSRLHCY